MADYGHQVYRIEPSGVDSTGGGSAQTSGTAYFGYLGGVTVQRVVIHKLWIKLHQGSGGASVTTAEIGIFSSVGPPSGSSMTLTCLLRANLGDVTTVGPALIQHAGPDVSYELSPGIHYWTGHRIVAGTMPSVSNVGTDPGLGMFSYTPSAATFVVGNTYSSLVFPPAGGRQAAYLTLD